MAITITIITIIIIMIIIVTYIRYVICFLYKILCIFLIYLSHSEYVKITDGVGTEVFHHQGCVPFATENLLDVQFGSSGNISVQVCLGNNQSSVKIKFAVLKNGISSGMF